MPEDPNAVFIMVATGTGIAPYRAFLRRMFVEDVPNYRFSGLAWLFMGVANSDAKLYDDEFQEILNTYPDQARSFLRVHVNPYEASTVSRCAAMLLYWSLQARTSIICAAIAVVGDKQSC